MGTRTQGTAIIRATSGHESKIVIDGCTSMEQLTTVLNKMVDYATFTVVSKSFTTTQADAVESVAIGNTDRKAQLKYRDNTAVKTRSITVSGWQTSGTGTVVESDGERVTAVAGNGIIEVVAGATGRDLTFLEGFIVQTK